MEERVKNPLTSVSKGSRKIKPQLQHSLLTEIQVPRKFNIKGVGGKNFVSEIVNHLWNLGYLFYQP